MIAFDAHWPAFVPVPGLPLELQRHINSFLKPTVIVAQQHFIVIKPKNFILTGHRGPVLSLQFMRDGNRFASSAADGTLRLWNKCYTSKIIKVGSGAVTHTKFTKSEDRVACVLNDKVHLFDVATGRPVTRVDLHDATIYTSRFGVFHKGLLAMISTMHKEQVAVYDLTTGKQQVRHNDFLSTINHMSTHDNLIVASSCNRVYCYKFDDPEYVRYMFMGGYNVTSVAVNDTYIVVIVDGRHAHVYNHRYQLKRIISMSFEVDALIPGPKNMFIGTRELFFKIQYVVLLDVVKGGFCKLYK